MTRPFGLSRHRLIGRYPVIKLTELVDLRRAATMTGAEDELTPAEAADILGVSPATVRRYEAATPTRGPLLIPRRLPGSGYRRYRRADVEWLRDHPEATEPRTGADPAPGEDGDAGSAGG